MSSQEDDLLPIRDPRRDQLIILLNVDRNNPARHHIREVLERRLLHRPIASSEKNILALFL